MDLCLKDKVAIVTGGGSGLGAAICDVLAREGAKVAVNYIVDQANVFRFVDRLNEKYNIGAIPLYGDITNPSDIDNIINTCVDIYGKTDILVNNAGVWPTAFVKDMSDEEWERVIKINLTGPFMFSKEWLITYRKKK